MLLILIPIAWLAAVSVLVAVCQLAARGDGRTDAPADEAPVRVRDGLVVWDRRAALALGDARATPGAGLRPRTRETHERRAVARRRRAAAHGAR